MSLKKNNKNTIWKYVPKKISFFEHYQPLMINLATEEINALD